MDRRKFINSMGMAGMGGAMFSSSASDARGLDYTDPAQLAMVPIILAGATLVAAVDAPSRVKRAADFVCTGTDDHLQINQAIDELGAVGGQVQLSQGTFYCASAVRLKRLTTLFGRGRSTVLKAVGTWPSFDGSEAQGGVIEPDSVSTDKTLVGYLTIDGNQYQGADVQGIYYHITTQGANWFGPDAGHYFTDVYILKTRRHAFHLAGGRMRATKVSRVRLFDTGSDDVTIAHGFYLDSPDGFFSMCESGGSTGHGFFVEGSNLHFTNCKSWFSKLNGWNITKPRGQYSSCEAQDNRQHGFYITAGPNSLVGCHADSNSWNAPNPESSFDGFHIPWGQRIQLVGCAAYDKGESSHNGYWQRDGFFIGNSAQNCQILGVAADNTRAAVTGGTNAANFVMVQG